MNVCYRTCKAFVTGSGPLCDSTSKFVHGPWNVWSTTNARQIQPFQNNLWANFWNFYNRSQFFFLKLMVVKHGLRLCVRGLCIATKEYSSFFGCALGLVLGVLDHMEVEVQDREQVEVREKSIRHERQRSKTKQRNNKRSNTWWHVDEHVFMQTRRATPWATMWCVHMDENVEKKSRVRCICLHSPSVTVDRYRLHTKPTVTEKRDLSKIKQNFELTSNSIRMPTTRRNL